MRQSGLQRMETLKFWEMECKKILGLSTVGNVIVIQLGKDTY